MRILHFLFGNTSGDSPGNAEITCRSCERVEERRQDSVRAYSEEHLFGYIDADGNMSSTPPDRHRNTI